VTTASLLKYQALGNDFLVALEPSLLPGGDELDKDFVVALCDRHRGVGADGVVALRRLPAGGGLRGDAAMELRNADGGRAETSGNALACLVLAGVDAGALAGPAVLMLTDAGPRRVTVLRRLDDATSLVRTEMGTASVSAEEPEVPSVPGWRARRVDMGNPHLVLLGTSLDAVDIGEIGRRLETAAPGGQNVEAVAPDGGGGLDLVVWERGAGLTQACGTGSCASAASARAIGLVGDEVEVHNPGGTLLVDLEGDLLSPAVSLTGPAKRVFSVDLTPNEVRWLV